MIPGIPSGSGKHHRRRWDGRLAKGKTGDTAARISELIEQGQQQLAAGSVDDAIEVFTEVLLHDASNVTALQALEQAYQKKNQPGAPSPAPAAVDQELAAAVDVPAAAIEEAIAAVEAAAAAKQEVATRPPAPAAPEPAAPEPDVVAADQGQGSAARAEPLPEPVPARQTAATATAPPLEPAMDTARPSEFLPEEPEPEFVKPASEALAQDEGPKPAREATAQDTGTEARTEPEPEILFVAPEPSRAPRPDPGPGAPGPTPAPQPDRAPRVPEPEPEPEPASAPPSDDGMYIQVRKPGAPPPAPIDRSEPLPDGKFPALPKPDESLPVVETPAPAATEPTPGAAPSAAAAPTPARAPIVDDATPVPTTATIEDAGAALPTRREEFTLPFLLDVLRQQGLLNEEQCSESEESADQVWSELLQDRFGASAGKLSYQRGGPRDPITPIEIVATQEFEAADGKLQVLNEDLITRAVARFAGVSFRKLRPRSLDAKTVCAAFSAEFARSQTAVSIEVGPGKVTVATDNPWNRTIVNHIRQHSGSEVELVMASRSEIDAVIDQFFGARERQKGIRNMQRAMTRQKGKQEIRKLIKRLVVLLILVGLAAYALTHIDQIRSALGGAADDVEQSMDDRDTVLGRLKDDIDHARDVVDQAQDRQAEQEQMLEQINREGRGP